MPNNFFSVESRFPNIEGKSQEEINGELLNYMYMLLEQLRYTLGNLGVGNFNESELNDIAGMISTPIYAKLEDAEGNITQLSLTAEGLVSRVESAEGDISTLTQTAEGLVSRVSSAEGDISTLSQTADRLTSRIEGAEGSISQLSQTASGLSVRVSSAEGDISVLEQTATGLSTRVSNAEGDISTLEQTANSISARVGDAEVAISDLGIRLNGTVTVSSLASATESTVINNATVTTTNAVGRYTSLTSGQLSFGLTGGQTAYIYGSEQGLWLGAYAGLFSESAYANLNASGNFVITGGSVQITANNGYFNVVSPYPPIFNGQYEFLRTDNMLLYIQNNAANIRALLGI